MESLMAVFILISFVTTTFWDAHRFPTFFRDPQFIQRWFVRWVIFMSIVYEAMSAAVIVSHFRVSENPWDLVPWAVSSAVVFLYSVIATICTSFCATCCRPTDLRHGFVRPVTCPTCGAARSPDEPSVWNMVASGLRRRLQVKLRTLVIVVPVVGLVLGLTVQRMNRWAWSIRAQQDAVAAVKAAGGTVWYDVQGEPPAWLSSGRATTTPAKPWFSRLREEYFGKVTWVGFGGIKCKPDTAALAAVGRLTDLQVVDFRPLNAGAGGLLHTHRSVADDALWHFRGLQQLERINLSGTSVRGPGLVELRSLPRLKSLEFWDVPLGDDDLAYLRIFGELEELALESQRISDVGLMHLSGMKKLRSLTLNCRSITSAGLDHLGGLTELRRLSAPYARIDKLEWIKPLKKLEHFNIDSARINDGDLVNLSGLSELSWIDLDGTEITDAGLRLLSQLPKCRHISVIGTHVTHEGTVEAVSRVRGLQMYTSGGLVGEWIPVP